MKGSNVKHSKGFYDNSVINSSNIEELRAYYKELLKAYQLEIKARVNLELKLEDIESLLDSTSVADKVSLFH